MLLNVNNLEVVELHKKHPMAKIGFHSRHHTLLDGVEPVVKAAGRLGIILSVGNISPGMKGSLKKIIFHPDKPMLSVYSSGGKQDFICKYKGEKSLEECVKKLKEVVPDYSLEFKTVSGLLKILSPKEEEDVKKKAILNHLSETEELATDIMGKIDPDKIIFLRYFMEVFKNNISH